MAPQSSALPVLITRPHAQAMRFADQLCGAFGDTVAPIISPLLAPEFLTPDLPPGPFGALILTSETGIRAAARLRKGEISLPNLAFCVGDHSTEVASGMGFEARSAGADAAALLQLLLAERQSAPFLHLHGRETAGNLVALLAAQGVSAHARVTYAQQEKTLTDEALALLKSESDVCVPLFSPRSARLFFKALGKCPPRAHLKIAAMSAAVAAECPPQYEESLTVATHPDALSMLAAVGAIRFKP